MKNLNLNMLEKEAGASSPPAGRYRAKRKTMPSSAACAKDVVTVAGAGDAPREGPRGKMRPHSSPPRYRSRSRRTDVIAARRSAGTAGSRRVAGGGALYLQHSSPSVSPGREPTPPHRLSPEHAFHSSQCTQRRFTGGSDSQPAYFAPHPPIAPLHLCVRPAASPPGEKLGARADVGTSAPMFPPPQAQGRSGNRRRVRSLLRELVARVPSEARRRRAGRDSSPPQQPAEPLWYARLAEEEGHAGAGAGWAQGVRALRDAHVRLVQRQLRHLRRLNAAVDAATLHAPAH